MDNRESRSEYAANTFLQQPIPKGDTMNRKTQRGFTLFELITALWALVCFGGFIALVCVAVHFIAKLW